mmetsp:Transcript_30949/g.98814  ORF Transcript_30949/g.98814 Transcript_30949/m.98814 type:complete len:126 (+) Transcript_30949:386-763(+)
MVATPRAGDSWRRLLPNPWLRGRLQPNGRGGNIKCSLYGLRNPPPSQPPAPCAVMCHGNNGSRAKANKAASALLPLGVQVLCFDFSAEGVVREAGSLNWHLVGDVKAVVEHAQGRLGGAPPLNLK